MKIVLHMGQGKTGTSSLQQSLSAAAEALRSKGVLYPTFTPGRPHHHLLVVLFGKTEVLPPWLLESLGGVAATEAAARAAWDKTCEDLRTGQFDMLVLSSEFLVGRTDGEEMRILGDLLKRISRDITPVIYVRHPVDHFRAHLQQWLKYRDLPFAPRDIQLKTAILKAEHAFGRRPELVAFDRQALVGGDIIRDFATRFLAPHIQPSDLPSVVANVGLSAEALVLLTQRRRELGGDYAASQQAARLFWTLETLDKSDPPQRPLTLLPEVADAALRVATSHRWLAETGQLQIPGLDITRIDGAPAPSWMTTVPPETLFHHDPDRLDRLRRAIEERRTGSVTRNPGKKPSENKKPSEKQIPRIRDLLLRFLLRNLASLQDRNTGAAPVRITSVQSSSQGDRNEDHSAAGNLDAGSRDRADPGARPDHRNRRA